MDTYRVEKSWDGSHQVRRTSGDEEICAAAGAAAGWVISAGVEGLAGLARHVKDRRLFKAVEDLRQAADSDQEDRFLSLATDFVRRYPGIPMGHAAYADALARSARYEPALRAIGRAVELGFDETEARMIRADIYDDAGQPGQAIQELTALAGSAEPEVRQISLLTRARLLRDIGDHERALTDADAALAVLPDGWAYTLRGHVYRAMGDLDRCLEDYSRAISLDPTEPGFRENRADVYEELGRSDEARTDRAAATELSADVRIDGARIDAVGPEESSSRVSAAPLLLVLVLVVLVVAAVVLVVNGLTAAADPATAALLTEVVRSAHA